ncbi:hypothetical protein Hypma_008212 [Hypsizygus marmoreus]|uniref:Uncharacterized protein n=1 Tax=Hypsizygus marmoreus TaxID=39966 RepID=A0A369K0X2_HYPMA|nr:hypothetical protein Hypma_008212 [Hypsizygus marmoreus]
MQSLHTSQAGVSTELNDAAIADAHTVKPAQNSVTHPQETMADITSLIHATYENTKVYNRNRDRIEGVSGVLLPLRKTVKGHGYDLAFAAAHDDAARNHLQRPVGPAPALNTLPPNFDGAFWEYQHEDILALMVFYNEDFSILPVDDLASRINKIRAFLVGA